LNKGKVAQFKYPKIWSKQVI